MSKKAYVLMTTEPVAAVDKFTDNFATIFTNRIKDIFNKVFLPAYKANTEQSVQNVFDDTSPTNPFLQTSRNKIIEKYQSVMQEKNHYTTGGMIKAIRRSGSYIRSNYNNTAKQIGLQIGDQSMPEAKTDRAFRYDRRWNKYERYNDASFQELVNWAIIKFNVSFMDATRIVQTMLKTRHRVTGSHIIYKRNSPYGSLPIKTDAEPTSDIVLDWYEDFAAEDYANIVEKIIDKNKKEIFK